MMAAAARRSGTRSPLASTLYRGVMVSAISRAVAAARAMSDFWRLEVARTGVFLRTVVDALLRFAVTRRVVGAASAGSVPKLTRQVTARVPIQKFVFRSTWRPAGCKLLEAQG